MYTCTPRQKTSKKGVEYFCIEITFPNGYKKTVYLDSAEQYIVMADIVNGNV